MVAAALTPLAGLLDDMVATALEEIGNAVERGMSSFGPAQPNGLDLNNQVMAVLGRAHARTFGEDTEDLAELSRIIDVAREWAPPGQRKRTAVVRATESIKEAVGDVAADVGQGLGVPPLKEGLPTPVKVAAGVGVALLALVVLSEVRAWIGIFSK